MDHDEAFRFEGSGTLRALELDYECTFTAVITNAAGAFCEVEVPLMPETAGSLLRLAHSNETAVPFVSLLGRAKTGEEIRSEYLSFASTRTHPGPDGRTTLSAVLRVYELDVDWTMGAASAEAEEVNEYFVPGARGFSVNEVESPYGRLVYQASAVLDDPGDVSGVIRLEPRAEVSCEEIELFVDRVLEILSLALGTKLRWAVRKKFVDDSLRTLRIRPLAKPPEAGFPVFSHLFLDPVMELAVEYSEEVRVDFGLGVAINWLLIRPTYREAEFLMGMTALEHIVSRGGDRITSVRISKEHFTSAVKPALQAALGEVEDLHADDRHFFQNRVAGLNFAPFSDRLARLLAADGVPLVGVEHAPRLLSRTRNRIVHKGTAVSKPGEDSNLIQALELLRELVVRIILNRLGFRGKYYSRLERVEFTDFPTA